MSYTRDLDEYMEHELVNELNRRKELQKKGLCDYCGRDGTTQSCKFHDRHQIAVNFITDKNEKLKNTSDVCNSCNSRYDRDSIK